MKFLSVLLSILVVLIWIAQAGATGKRALEVVGRNVADGTQGGVVKVIGIQGKDDRPAEWRVVVKDADRAGEFHRYTVRGGSVVGRENVRKEFRGEVPGSAIPHEEVLVDSDVVFSIADQEAKEAKVGFDSVNYELRCRELSDEPVWNLDLRDQNNSVVGRLFVSATSGDVLQRTWFPRSESRIQIPAEQEGAKVVEKKKARAKSPTMRRSRSGRGFTGGRAASPATPTPTQASLETKKLASNDTGKKINLLAPFRAVSKGVSRMKEAALD